MAAIGGKKAGVTRWRGQWFCVRHKKQTISSAQEVSWCFARRTDGAQVFHGVFELVFASDDFPLRSGAPRSTVRETDPATRRTERGAHALSDGMTSNINRKRVEVVSSQEGSRVRVANSDANICQYMPRVWRTKSGLPTPKPVLGLESILLAGGSPYFKTKTSFYWSWSCKKNNT